MSDRQAAKPSDTLGPRSMVADGEAQPDAQTWVGMAVNARLPAYRKLSSDGNASCLPFLPRALFTPPGRTALDYYVNDFSNQAMRQDAARYAAEPGGAARLAEAVAPFRPPKLSRHTGRLDRFGAIDADGVVDLADIRRPGYFGRYPYQESVAGLDGVASTVEFTVPPEAYERLKLGRSVPVAIRGWYLAGEGVSSASGRRRTLVIMNPPGGANITGIDHPDTATYLYDSKLDVTRRADNPALTESIGMRSWRQLAVDFQGQGFDVLLYDRRGAGVSGGANSSNTLEQSEDIFRMLEQLETGIGLRVLTPEGRLVSGAAAGGILTGGLRRDEIPVLLAGYSRGTMVAGWAMKANVDGYCSYDQDPVICEPPRRWGNIKGALLISAFIAGPGNAPVGDHPNASLKINLAEGHIRNEFNTLWWPSSEILKSTPKWPALFVAKGLWDDAEAIEGTLDTMRAMPGAKEIYLVKGGHSYDSWAPDAVARMKVRMLAFAKAVALDQAPDTPPIPSTLKAAVLSADDAYAPAQGRPASPALKKFNDEMC